jgi:hypothetical protein
MVTETGTVYGLFPCSSVSGSSIVSCIAMRSP